MPAGYGILRIAAKSYFLLERYIYSFMVTFFTII